MKEKTTKEKEVKTVEEPKAEEPKYWVPSVRQWLTKKEIENLNK